MREWCFAAFKNETEEPIEDKKDVHYRWASCYRSRFEKGDLRKMVANAMGNRGEAGPPHPRTIGWIGTTALAMGGSNQSLFLIGALFLSQGSAAVPLLIVGLLLSWAAAFGWTELILKCHGRALPGGLRGTCL